MKLLAFATLTVVAGAAVVLALAGADWPTMRYRQDDFIAYWTAATALLEHVDPYDPAVYRALHDAVGSRGSEIIMPGAGFSSPLPTAVATMPFALLPVAVAAPVWFVTQLVTAVAALVALGRRIFIVRPRRDLVLLLVLAAVMQPTFLLSGDGNITHYLVGIVGGSLALLLARHPFASGLLLGLAIVKPHLLVVYVVALVLFTPERDRPRLVVGGALSSGTLLAISIVLRPDWIGEWLAQTARLPPDVYGSATLWAVLPGDLHWVAVGAAALALAALFLWQRRASPPLAVSAGAALSLSVFLAPYAYTGDQAVLLVGVAAFIALVAALPARMRALFLLALIVTSSAWFLPWAAGLVPAGIELTLPAAALFVLLIAAQLSSRVARGFRGRTPYASS